MARGEDTTAARLALEAHQMAHRCASAVASRAISAATAPKEVVEEEAATAAGKRLSADWGR